MEIMCVVNENRLCMNAVGLFAYNFWIDLGRPNASWNEKTGIRKPDPLSTDVFVYKSMFEKQVGQT